MTASGIYTGSLRHRRFHPKKHDFTYPLFMTLLDIDRIPELMRGAWFSSYNRFNWAAFHDADHFGDPKRPLRERVELSAAENGVTLPDGKILLLTHLRYLGYAFNPISLFYCHDSGGVLKCILAEVNSTFGETRNYWLTSANALESANSHRYRCAKEMHVSPFMKMNLDYEFVLTEPGERLVAHMNTLDDGSSFFDATLTLKREPWSKAALRNALLRFPWMTLKVITAIHWEALRLYLKKVPVFSHP